MSEAPDAIEYVNEFDEIGPSAVNDEFGPTVAVAETEYSKPGEVGSVHVAVHVAVALGLPLLTGILIDEQVDPVNDPPVAAGVITTVWPPQAPGGLEFELTAKFAVKVTKTPVPPPAKGYV